MGCNCIKDNENVYFRARKDASMYNERLCSRESAAELLGISSSTLADYELGITKVVPVDKVILMADLYNKPELKNGYCKYECPIGKTKPLATEIKGIEGVALRLIKQFDSRKLKDLKMELIEIAEDGVISEDEKPKMIKIINSLGDLSKVISEVMLLGEKLLKS